jgi:hypothetical protein
VSTGCRCRSPARECQPAAGGGRDRSATPSSGRPGGSWPPQAWPPWDVIRRKLRFVGVTVRHKTSPNTFRWQQHAPWTRLLPARAVLNVSLDWPAWTYLADRQVKLTRSFTPDRWLADAADPDRGEPTRQALAEAAALVAYGRTPAGRTELARAVAGEPGLAEPWLRSLVTDLSRRR